MAIDETATGKRTRTPVTARRYSFEDGDKRARNPIGAIGVELELISGGDTFEAKLNDFAPEVQKGLMAFGLITLLTNELGGVTDPAEQFESVDNRLQALLQGEWSEGRASGPRTSDIVDAFVRWRAKHGKDTPEDKKSEFAKLMADEDVRKATLKDPANAGLDAELKAIKAERMAARASAQAEKAAGVTTVSTLLD